MLPYLHVLPVKEVPGLSKIISMTPDVGQPFGLSGKNKPVDYVMDRFSVEDAMNNYFQQEAMFVCYRERNDLAIPRMNKTTEGQVDLVADFAAFDIDLKEIFNTKNKLPWSSLSIAQQELMELKIQKVLAALEAKDAGAYYWYRSKNGLRFFHVLSMTVTVAGLELIFQRLFSIYSEAGMAVDDACKDWTRVFKLPRCILDDGTVTGDADWFRDAWPKHVTLVEPDEVMAKPVLRSAGDLYSGDRKELSHARELIVLDGKQTEEGRAASAHLSRNPRLHGICFDSQPICARGQGVTHLTLTQVCGELCRKCVGQPWATEEFLFALLSDSINLLGDDEPWADKAWEMICSYLARDRADLEARSEAIKKELAAKAALPAKTPLEVFADGVKLWMPEWRDAEATRVKEMAKALKLGIISHQERHICYPLMPNGFYSNTPCSPEKISLKLREEGMEWLVPTEIETIGKDKKPRIVERSWQNYMRDDVKTYARVRMKCVHRGNYVEFNKDTNETELIISPFWLRDLEPHFDERVAEFLAKAAPDGQAENLVLALAYLLAFRYGPTAAVALIGPASVGKKMIARGLAECINTQCLVNGRVLVSRFNGGLVRSPIIWIDEGLPKGKDGVDLADTFRNLVTGGDLTVEPKGAETFEVSGVHRIIITANNDDVISQLGDGKARTSDDLDALTERLAVFHLQHRAVDWLHSKGDHDFTRGWIAGDNGEPSDYVIAKHLMWHFKNTIEWRNGHPVRKGKRLLYEGDKMGFARGVIDEANPELPEVAACINEMLRGSGASFKGNCIYANPSVLRSRCCGAGTGRMLPSEFRRAVRALQIENHHTTVDGINARYCVFDPQRIYQLCHRLTPLSDPMAKWLKEHA